MPVYYDTDEHDFVIASDECRDCGELLYQSGCDAPGCNGLACPDCGTGCDYDFLSLEDGGRCATALDEESDEDYEERLDEERAAFGLSSVAAEKES